MTQGVQAGPWLLVGIVLLGCSCAVPSRNEGPNRVAELVPDERAPLDWARDEDWFVWVRRSCRTLSVYRKGEWVRTYHHVSFGRVPGDKLHEGDRKTPLGLYRMIGRRRHPRWSRFILLDYPNVRDREVNRMAQEQGRAPRGPGGQIGIHGSDEPVLNQGGVDWTYGCISLLNEDVRELYTTVPPGTLVLVEE